MVTDKEVNTLFFSDLVKTADEYLPAFERVQIILDRHQVNYRLLKNTKDIWCRDYMPIQLETDDYVQFRYEPSYLQDSLELQSEPQTILATNGIKARFSNINLDGGNVVRSLDKVIITTRIFKENPSVNRHKLVADIESLLGVEVLLIPDVKDDMTGHADGHVRFVNKNTILVNQLEGEYKYWQKGFLGMIKSSGLTYIEIPWFDYKESKYADSAIGSYLNYLELGNLILLPVFEVSGNKDAEVVNLLSSVFADRIVETVNINEIAHHGGLLNCVTWTIKA